MEKNTIKKAIIRIAGIIAITAVIGLAMTSCDLLDASNLEGIEVTRNPEKMIYNAGETLDTTGIEVTATFLDGLTQVITSGLSFNPTILNTAGTIPITVTYMGKSTSFNVTVNAANGETDTALNGIWVGTVESSWASAEHEACAQFPRCGGPWAPAPAGCSDCKIIYNSGTELIEVELTVNNGNFEVSEDGIPTQKGTYTTSNGNIIIRPTHIYSDISSPAGRWYTRDEYRAALIQTGTSAADAEQMAGELFAPETLRYSVSGNTLTLILEEAIILTKKGDVTPPLPVTLTSIAVTQTYL